jgi:hypothetical protein
MAENENKNNDVNLLVEIGYTEKLKLSDTAKSLSALSDLFDFYVDYTLKTQDYSLDKNEKPSLYIRQVTQGSFILDLIQYGQYALEGAGGIVTVIAFVEYVRKAYKYLVNKLQEDKSTDIFKKQDKALDLLVKFVSLSAKNGSYINIKTNIFDKSGNRVEIRITSDNAKEITENRTRIKKIDRISNTELYEVNSVYKLNSARERVNDVELILKKMSTDFNLDSEAIIESLNKKPVKVFCESNELLKLIYRNDLNPFKKRYVVDVVVDNIGNNITAYNIVKFHEDFPL